MVTIYSNNTHFHPLAFLVDGSSWIVHVLFNVWTVISFSIASCLLTHQWKKMLHCTRMKKKLKMSKAIKD